MKKAYIAGYLIMGLFLLSCNQQADTKSSLVGSWKNNHIEINMKTFNNGLSDSIFIALPETWDSVMKVQPIITHFYDDNTYNSVHKELSGEVFYNPGGIWELQGDTIIMTDTFGKRLSYKYKYKVTGDKAEFWGVEDMDSDGQNDDEYYGVQVRIQQQ